MAEKEVGNLRTRLSWEDEGSTRSLKGFKDDLKGLRSEMNATKGMGKEYTQSLKGLREQSDILTRQMKTQKNQVSELRKRYEEVKRVKGEDADQTKRLANQYNNAVAQMNKTENQLSRVTSEIEKQINPWKRLGENATSAGEKMQSIGRGLSDFGQAYSLRVTAPIVASGVAAFKLASDFESAFAGVEKTFSGSSEQLASLREGIRDMAKEIPASTTEIAAVAEAAGQLGIQTENIEGFTRTMIDLGEATNMTSDVAATEFARFANIVGMSQDDFDRLGSSVVALGNSMATTESEISSMAMRLAAQGSQVGMSEAQIMALAATMSSLGIEAEAGGTAMTTVLKKIQNSVGEGGKELKAFAKASGVSSEEFKKAWEKDAVVALDMLVKGLGESAGEGKNLTTILDTLGIKGIREADTMLRMAGASDLLSDAVNTSSKAWEENSALSDEAAQRYKTTESQLKILVNRAKDVGITLGEALIPAMMDAIDAAEPLIKQIESGAKAFSEMDEQQQQTILKMIGLVAAVGPASMILGDLTTAVGGVFKAGGGLANLLGKSGGTGLVGRLGLLGLGGPVGLAVAGVGALGLGIYALTEASEENLEETVKSIQARKEEIDATDNLIASYEKLQRKNKLSTDEVLRYMDIMSELKDAKSEETIKKLTKEQQHLLEKSGFTNEEMETFLGLNDKIIEKSPSTSQAISEQGNAYAGVVDELKKLNQAERERLTGETQNALSSELIKQRDRLAEQKDLQDDLNKLEQIRDEKLQNLIDRQNNLVNLSGNELRVAKKLLEADRDIYDDLLKKIEGKKESIKESDKELALFEELKDDYAQMILYEQGIVSEKGRANEAMQQQQSEIDTARAKLKELKDQGVIGTNEFRRQNEQLNEQQRKIDVAKGKLQAMNKEAGRTIYKDVKTNVTPSIQSINRDLASGVRKTVSVFTALDGNYRRLSDPTAKTVNIRTVGGYHVEPGYATGTNYHPGGGFIAGEQGYELGRLGDQWEMLNFGRYNRPAGYEVFTHDESKKILGALNKLPAYATGVSRSGEVDRVVGQLNNQEHSVQNLANKQSLIIQMVTPDKRVLAEMVVDDVTAYQNKNKRINRRNTGKG